MNLDYFQDLIHKYAEIFGLVTFLAGLVFGNWLAIGRDRRKEFNESAQPVRAWLIDEIERPSPYGRRPKPIEIDTFVNCLPLWKRRAFRLAYELQDQARNEARTQGTTGEVFYRNDADIKDRLRKCLRYTERQ